MRGQDSIGRKVDLTAILIYAALVLMGWLNIYASVYEEGADISIFSLSINSGKQLLWIATAAVIIVFIMIIEFQFYSSVAYIIYGILIGLLILVLFFGKEVSGARSWFELGSFRLQPSEFVKFGTALALARFFQDPSAKLDNLKNVFIAAMIIIVPAILIVLQPDPGTALVFGSFIIVLYREGLPGIIPVLGIVFVAIFVLTLLLPFQTLFIGIGVVLAIVLIIVRRSWRNIAISIACFALIFGAVFGVDYFVNNILKPHQQNRIKVLFNPNIDPLGVGWNVTQSKIAIGSGGFGGKGFLEGTQTKFDFVPEQSTDFIFCTIGEEHGWIGSLVLIGLFTALLFRIIAISERQKSRFARVYGYSVASILFFHFLINIGMTIGLFPVVGIPLPFFSYGGSSLWTFTVLLFILIKIDAHRMQVFAR
ncbi:MAG: rod shape-determining protein RodA [Bacteroidota bacterium]